MTEQRADIPARSHVLSGPRGLGREPTESAGLGGDHAASRLTVREHEVVSLLAEGCSAADVAERLGIAVGTVNTHARRAMHKLHASDRRELISIARRAAALDIDE